MSLKLYYDLMSQPSRALYIFLKKCAIPFEEKGIRLAKADHFSEEYEKINRFRRVPAISDGDLKLSESVAILRYLCREKNVDDHWYPKDSKKMAKVDEFLEYQHIDLRIPCSMYFLTKYLQPIMTGEPAKPHRVEQCKEKMIDSLDKIENIWLKDNEFIVGNQISIADILAACEIEQTRIAGYDPCDGRPKMNGWFEKIKKDLNPHYEEAHKIVYKIATKYKGNPPL